MSNDQELPLQYESISECKRLNVPGNASDWQVYTRRNG